jgi:hypothetical protein
VPSERHNLCRWSQQASLQWVILLEQRNFRIHIRLDSFPRSREVLIAMNGLKSRMLHFPRLIGAPHSEEKTLIDVSDVGVKCSGSGTKKSVPRVPGWSYVLRSPFVGQPTHSNIRRTLVPIKLNQMVSATVTAGSQ